MGFFLHIPWPARELLVTLPQHRALVRSLFAYDLVGFQCEAWRSAFQAYVENEAGGEADAAGRLNAFGEHTEAGVFPIGIDAAAFAAIAGSSNAERSFTRAAATGVFRSMIISVDRVDYAKGLETRFLAIERLLQWRPDLVEKVFLLQVAQPSRQEVRAYADIHHTLDALSGRINGRFATVDWTPIRYLNHSYNRDHIAGLYRAARIGLVTPLRDGMNLVAKEFVAAQDPEDPGVLILSCFAGAAAQMSAALIVNPYSLEDVADAIVKALEMDKQERIERWTSLMEGVVGQDAARWRSSFLEALQSVSAPLPDSAPLPEEEAPISDSVGTRRQTAPPLGALSPSD
jgi:trehalose 6-phosphate synthase